ncbi:MAG: hypothetical protein LBE84_02300 [Planctomycetota bacterium]|jgi:hypothetical protein|nr:hypothetical protein [Planctomycetota bacterium]
MGTPKNQTDAMAPQELLIRKIGSPGPHPPRTMEHLAFAVMDANGIETAEILAVLERLRREFVDWNEIRVARRQELARALGGISGAERIAQRLKESYNRFFDKRGALGFEFLAAMKLSDAKRALGQTLPELSKSAGSLLLREFCTGMSLPISDAGLKQAGKDGLAGKNPDRGRLASVLSSSTLNPESVSLLLQYWELEAAGHPYGPAGKKESAARAIKAGTPAAKKKKPDGKRPVGKRAPDNAETARPLRPEGSGDSRERARRQVTPALEAKGTDQAGVAKPAAKSAAKKPAGDRSEKSKRAAASPVKPAVKAAAKTAAPTK